MTAAQKVHMRRCASSFVASAYERLRLNDEGPGAQTGSPACGATGRNEIGFSSLPELAARRAASPSRALPLGLFAKSFQNERFINFSRGYYS
jgi:hypothetical protein